MLPAMMKGDGRPRGRASWFNVYERMSDGARTRSYPFTTRARAMAQQAIQEKFNGRKCLYRVRVKLYLERKQ